jgi:hypothetical protein
MPSSSTGSSSLVAWLSATRLPQIGKYLHRSFSLKWVPNMITDLSCSEFTVGGTISVSVDVSGNGRLPRDSWGPDSTLPSGFISLSIFLVSANQNLTIVNGTTGDFLKGEPGSTVKHLNYVVPSCLPEGDYEVSPLCPFINCGISKLTHLYPVYIL